MSPGSSGPPGLQGLSFIEAPGGLFKPNLGAFRHLSPGGREAWARGMPQALGLRWCFGAMASGIGRLVRPSRVGQIWSKSVSLPSIQIQAPIPQRVLAETHRSNVTWVHVAG